jgi:WD40 repeat protein
MQDLRRFQGHTAAVVDLAFLRGSRDVVTASLDGTVRIWELQSEQQLHIFDVASPVVSFAVCGEDRFAVLGPDSNRVKLYGLTDGSVMGELESHAVALLDVACSSDGTHVAAAGVDGHVYVWNSVDSTLCAELSGHLGRVSAVALNRDGSQLVSGGDDGTVRIWNVVEQTELRQFEGHSGAVNCVAFAPDGTMAVSGGQDRKACIWKVPDR